MAHWSDKYWTPENLCARCEHPRTSHLDQPELKGGPPSSDRGWCTLPPGTCIFNPCKCKAFEEPSDDLIAERSRELAAQPEPVTYGNGRYRHMKG